VNGPEAGLALVDRVAVAIGDTHRVDAVRAHLLEMAGNTVEAARIYASAANGATSLPERRHLLTRAARLRH
jgi:predicted RNA polymerase sigma factor